MPVKSTKAKSKSKGAPASDATTIDGLLAHIKSLTEANAMQASAIVAGRVAGQPPQAVAIGSLSVGIRSISNTTVGLPASPVAGEQAVTLHAKHRDRFSPESQATISYAYWLQLRRHPWYGKGLYVRDDSIMGPGYVAAPADRDIDLAPGWEHNQIHDPKQWIESRTDKQIKADLKLITSEDSLRRLAYECDKICEDARAANKAAEEVTNEARRRELEVDAAEALPSLYRYAEQQIDLCIAALYDAQDAIRRPESGKGLVVTVKGVDK